MHTVLLNPLAHTSNKERGAVYTKREVVEAILDLIGYSPCVALSEISILEPCCGKGDFLLPIVERLHASYLRHGGEPKIAYAALNMDSALMSAEGPAPCQNE